MRYDVYTELSGREIIPFVDFEEDSKAVHCLNYPVSITHTDYKKEYGMLKLWIQYENPYYFLYLSVAVLESLGYSIQFDGSRQHAKVRLFLAERNTKDNYYRAGVKASVWGRKIVEQCCPHLVVDWQEGSAYEKPKGENFVKASRKFYEEVQMGFFREEEGALG